MLKHRKQAPNRERKNILKQGTKNFDLDGLNNLKYTSIARGISPTTKHFFFIGILAIRSSACRSTPW